MKKTILKKILIIFLITSNSINSDSMPIGNPFNKMMDALSNRAKDLLDKATTDGLILETNAGEQILNTIGNVQIAYEKELRATSHVINGHEQSIISDITDILDQIQNHTIESISSKITQIALLIPWLGNLPQLTTWSGNIIMVNTANPSINIKGVFKYANNKKYEPIMEVAGIKCRNTEKTLTTLAFDLPIKKLIHLKNKVSYIIASLKIPYENHFWQGKQNADYKIKIILLPLNAGTFKFITSTYIDETKTLTKSCELSWAGHEDLSKYCYPDAGYTIDINSISRNLIDERGPGFGHDHYDLGHDYNTPNVSISFHIRGDDDESLVAYRITYSEFKINSIPIDTSFLGEEPVKWGNSKVYTKKNDEATWKAIYTQFDGRKVAFASSSESNPYVRIKQIGNQIVVSYAPFDY